MDITQEQKVHAQIVQKAWDDAEFKKDLIANPVETIEQFTGNKINLPEGQTLVVKDQTDTSTIYFNIPRKIDVNELELTDEQLEMVAGGSDAIVIGLAIGGAFGAALLVGYTTGPHAR